MHQPSQSRQIQFAQTQSRMPLDRMMSQVAHCRGSDRFGGKYSNRRLALGSAAREAPVRRPSNGCIGALIDPIGRSLVR
jgi:hypothetical protein